MRKSSLRAAVIAVAGLAVSSVGCTGPLAVKPAPRPAPLEPAIRTLEVGRSVEGRAIRMHIFGPEGPTTFIFAGIHGDEPTSEYVALRLAEYLLAHPEVYACRRIAVLPSANPDGLFRGTRGNANGVDCNRNFPAKNWKPGAKDPRHDPGPAPSSEPETRAILKAIEMLKPVRIVSIHSAKTIPPCNNYDGPARGLAEVMSRHNGYELRSEMGYRTPGSFGTWAGVERKIPTITLELPRNVPGPKVWPRNRDALLAFIQFIPPPVRRE